MLLFGKKARIGDLCAQIATRAEEAIVIIDRNSEIIFFNEGAEKVFGYTASEITGQKLDTLLPERFHIQHDMMIHEFGNSEARGKSSDDRHRQIYGRRKSGEEFVASASIFDLSRGDQKFYGALVRDISKNRKTEEELLRLAATDPLTGAFNRREFTSIAEREALRASRYHHPMSVLMLDLDHFKRLNDTYGHGAGDKALQRFTMICTNALRNVDVFGRWGGEEFVALLPETDIQGATVIAERLRKLTADNLLTYNDHKINFTVSIGIAEFKDGETSIDGVLGRADNAVYDAKKAGRDRISVFRN
ncbi:MAG: diguanylate cyclase [Alphaproteobacteria bacterium]